MKKLAIVIVALLCCLYSKAQTPKYEVRAVWLTTLSGIDWPHSYNSTRQKEELSIILDRLHDAGINTVLYQARIRGTATFPSSFEPWDGCMTGKPGVAPSFDPLQLVIDECHRRGMELHAWVVTVPTGKWNSYGCKQLRKARPALMKKVGDDGFLNPELPQTADYLARFCLDIVKRYDVDGIHLDYIRYPETWPKARSVAERTARKNNITRIVRAIHQSVKTEKPWVKMSCSPVGKYDDLLRYRSGGWNARTAVSQDAQAWLREGLMDELFPMMYFRDNHFFPFAIDWQEQSAGRIVVPGLGIYFLDPREGKWVLSDVTRQLNVARQLGMGHCFFRSKFFTDNVKGIYDYTRLFNAQPSLVPPMTWAGKTPPSAPANLSRKGTTLSWSEAVNNNDSPYLIYNIYASGEYPVDISDPRNLMVTRTRATNWQVPADKNVYYAVTACDRYGQESSAVQLPGGNDWRFWQTDDIIRTDGRRLLLPEKPNTLDADVLLIETLQGQRLGSYTYTGKYVDISHLPNGMYVMRSLGKKKRSHRLGYFSIKR